MKNLFVFFVIIIFCFTPFNFVSAYYSQIDEKTGKEVIVFDMNDVFEKLESMDEKMVTKEDLMNVKKELREDIRGVESSLSSDIDSLSEDIRSIWSVLIGLIVAIFVALFGVKFIFQKEMTEIATDISKKESRITYSEFHHNKAL